MPTYSYRCRACDEAFDIQQAFTDDTLTVCPACGGELRKVFSAVGVSFSGSGFYRNDSRAESKAASSESSSTSAGSGAKEKPAPAAAPAPAAPAAAAPAAN